MAIEMTEDRGYSEIRATVQYVHVRDIFFCDSQDFRLFFFVFFFFTRFHRVLE